MLRILSVIIDKDRLNTKEHESCYTHGVGKYMQDQYQEQGRPVRAIFEYEIVPSANGETYPLVQNC